MRAYLQQLLNTRATPVMTVAVVAVAAIVEGAAVTRIADRFVHPGRLLYHLSGTRAGDPHQQELDRARASFSASGLELTDLKSYWTIRTARVVLPDVSDNQAQAEGLRAVSLLRMTLPGHQRYSVLVSSRSVPGEWPRYRGSAELRDFPDKLTLDWHPGLRPRRPDPSVDGRAS